MEIHRSIPNNLYKLLEPLLPVLRLLHRNSGCKRYLSPIFNCYPHTSSHPFPWRHPPNLRSSFSEGSATLQWKWENRKDSLHKLPSAGSSGYNYGGLKHFKKWLCLLCLFIILVFPNIWSKAADSIKFSGTKTIQVQLKQQQCKVLQSHINITKTITVIKKQEL